jgi:two-component system OmpR family response regulator
MKILVVEDDSKINDFVCKGLREAGFAVSGVHDGQEGLDAILVDQGLDLVILDLMLPGKDGLQVLREVRSAGKQLPIIVLSAKRSVDERVEGLGLGADDYLVKPFAFSELLARIQVLSRRHQPARPPVTHFSNFGIELDLLKREVHRDGQLIELQAKEFALLEYLSKNPERVISKTMILEHVYHYNFDTQTNIVDVLVCRLRNKIDKDFDKKTIHTIRGVGYVFKEE